MASLPARVPARVLVERVAPQIDGGRFPIKRTIGEDVVVSADLFADGHDMLAGALRYRPAGGEWTEEPLTPLGNDRWSARFSVTRLGRYEYAVEAWIDGFATWRRDLSRKVDAGQDIATDLLEGAELVAQAARRAGVEDAAWLRARAEALGKGDPGARTKAALDPALAAVMARYPDRTGAATSGAPLTVLVDRELARFGAWYELFPRSCSSELGQHGTFRDLERLLPEIARMGFDVVYLPPIHPIGRSFRKGPNNSLEAGPSDPGSPWAIGAAEGGHCAIHPELGTLNDFDHLLLAAREHGLEIALDIAFQCSPDHPWVREHPGWFRHRPDGTIKYAENPPKKYQDIYPVDFECADWQNLWRALLDVFLFWCERGVRVFRVDNPHTKPFPFWEWLIGQAQARHPDTIYLSEAFTRPKVMRYLAKAGFSQSYTYFTWRNSRAELTDYFTELTRTEAHEYLRPNLFANTPDILPELLQYGGPAAFRLRLVLAATLGASYGIYGPPFEMMEGAAVRHGSEEYLDSEKYQLRHWDWGRPNPFREFIARVNRVRRENPALQYNERLRFFPVENEQLLVYSKSTPDLADVVLVVANLDPHHAQSGWVRLPPDELGLRAGESYQAHDLLTDARFLWGEANFVRLDPAVTPAHLLRVRRRVRTERDFDYFF